jgi:hypothetical protein
VSLVAGGVTADPAGAVASVAFYRETNSLQGLQIGAFGDALVGLGRNAACT